MARPVSRGHEIERFILWNVEASPSAIVTKAAEQFGISRPAAFRYIKKLVDEGALLAEGNTRRRAYKLAILEEKTVTLPLDGLEEDTVWDEQFRQLVESFPPNIRTICYYGFTEIVNNAIDHSEGSHVALSFGRTAKSIRFSILDNGVGIFEKIQKSVGLSHPAEAVLELSKGKFTTDPAKHSGEGIFFTTRIFDIFVMSSGGLLFSTLEAQRDYIWEAPQAVKDIKGTVVSMELDPQTKRTTKEVFDRFTTDLEEYGFDRTIIPITLARAGEDQLISRSQAKRVLARVERFKEVVLDFKDVESIGQAFADEIFRVFASAHSDVHFLVINANKEVQQMINRAMKAREEMQKHAE